MMFIRAAVVAVTTAAPIGMASGCSARDAPASAPPSLSACVVHDALPAIEEALCRSDGAMMASAVLQLGQTPLIGDGTVGELVNRRDELLRSQYTVLARVYRGERSSGEGMPWNGLENAEFRATLAVVLSQAARNGHGTVSLSELRNFASEYFSSQPPSDLAFELVGAADVAQLSDLTAPYLVKADVKNVAALMALAASCASEADNQLQSLLALPHWQTPEGQRRWNEAQSFRALVLRDWCGPGG